MTLEQSEQKTNIFPPAIMEFDLEQTEYLKRLALEKEMKPKQLVFHALEVYEAIQLTLRQDPRLFGVLQSWDRLSDVELVARAVSDYMNNRLVEIRSELSGLLDSTQTPPENPPQI